MSVKCDERTEQKTRAAKDRCRVGRREEIEGEECTVKCNCGKGGRWCVSKCLYADHC